MKLIKLLYDHYIVVTDSDIKENQYYCNNKVLFLSDSKFNVGNNPNQNKNNKLVIYSTLPLSFLQEKGFTTSNLKPDWSNVKELSLTEVEEAINGYSTYELFKKIDGSCEKDQYEHWLFKEGFKAHQELTKDKLFTIEDMREAFFDMEYPHSEIDFEHLLARSGFKTEWDIEINEQNKIKLL
jgi:hypothetical protein